ncbi:MAG: GNAT family N-acetyltransferase [Oscillospiraceae bacterium]
MWRTSPRWSVCASPRLGAKTPLRRSWKPASASGSSRGWTAHLRAMSARSSPPEADMMNLAVVPELRRRGTAQALLQALQERLAARGIGSLTLEVRASNLPAQRLYTAAGFACIGRRPNYYLAPREDALILRKELDHADPCH